MAKDRAIREGISWAEAFDRIESEDLESREEVLKKVESAIAIRNVVEVDVAIKNFTEVSENSYGYGLYKEEDQQ